jgi:tellurite resistance protein TerC
MTRSSNTDHPAAQEASPAGLPPTVFPAPVFPAPGMERSPWLVYRLARKVVVSVVGGSVVLVGVVMFVTPGPALVVIPAGLAILATEYVWAQRWLERMRQETIRAVRAVRGGFEGRQVPNPPSPDANEGGRPGKRQDANEGGGGVALGGATD